MIFYYGITMNLKNDKTEKYLSQAVKEKLHKF